MGAGKWPSAKRGEFRVLDGHFIRLACCWPDPGGMVSDKQRNSRGYSTSLGRSTTTKRHEKNMNKCREEEHFAEGTARNGRRSSNSLGRRQQPMPVDTDENGNGHHQMASTEEKQPDSAERHRNEKILASDSIVRLPGRSAFYKIFELGSQIGQGNFSDVFLVYNAENGTKFAVKEVDKARMRAKLHFVANEIALLQRSQHRHICRLVEAYECQSLYFLVFEYAQKGDLFETIKRVGRLCERSAAQITRQIASALAFLHRRQIVHRDVKPENILLCSDSTVKLTDFGLACVVLGPLYRICGTPTYVAPEVLTQQGYGIQVDIWSLGIILYICLAGFAPFRCSERMQLFNQIVRARPSFHLPCWSRVTVKAKQLLLAMLVSSPEARMTADQLLTNEWILNGGGGHVDGGDCTVLRDNK